jgi:homoserine O-acetyltransferase/O-succinyltransferase
MTRNIIENKHKSPNEPYQYQGAAPSSLRYYKYDQAFDLESGESLPELTIAYHTFGTLNSHQSNIVWIIHALTANCNPVEWWPGIVGDKLAIDPNKHFIVCANCIGSPYGSTSPLTVNPISSEPYYHDFPFISQRDQARAFDLLRLHLGIKKINLVVGASMGGQQALEWNILKPDIFVHLLLIATNAVHSPWGIAFNESQRLAIQADTSWTERKQNAGSNGLLAARSIALLSYRSYDGYRETQAEKSNNKFDNFDAASYQRYQGQKLVSRFNSFSYMTLSKGMDSHNIGRDRSKIEDVLSTIVAKTHIIGIDTDILFPIIEQKFLNLYIKGSKLHTISSSLGHDGFLTESKLVGGVIDGFLI